jgi:NAD(P)-dependent dehydrogenase (short-subunit alcohol dehydrogenase family)
MKPHARHTGLLQGRTALVTGAGQGNGRALGHRAGAGRRAMVCTDINAATVAETAALIGRRRPRRHQVLDVTDFAACQRWPRSLAPMAGPSTCWSTTPAS